MPLCHVGWRFSWVLQASWCWSHQERWVLCVWVVLLLVDESHEDRQSLSYKYSVQAWGVTVILWWLEFDHLKLWMVDLMLAILAVQVFQNLPRCTAITKHCQWRGLACSSTIRAPQLTWVIERQPYNYGLWPCSQVSQVGSMDRHRLVTYMIPVHVYRHVSEL